MLWGQNVPKNWVNNKDIKKKNKKKTEQLWFLCPISTPNSCLPRMCPFYSKNNSLYFQIIPARFSAAGGVFSEYRNGSHGYWNGSVWLWWSVFWWPAVWFWVWGKNYNFLLTLKRPRKYASENVVCLCRLLNILANFSNLFLHTGKQCGPRSDCS